MAGEGGAISLLETPTWAVATVCFIFIFLGIFVEHLIDRAGHWLRKHKKTALYDAMEKLKSVLMLLGFMSLILTVTQQYIMKICIPSNVANSMLPCRKRPQDFTGYDSDEASGHCASKGMTPFMSEEGINQLNIFIFVLAAMQIISSVATMALGRAKMKRWKTWEKETQTIDYKIAHDPERFRFTRETTFGRRHVNLGDTNPTLLWIKCFYNQFFRSVVKVDYLTLRHGFISAHFSSPTNSFNFQKYIQRSLEDDFKEVIGISPVMWLIVVIFLALDVHGWNSYLWISFLPLIIVLFIGTKLKVIVAKMAIKMANQNTVIRGIPVVQLNNNLFWFNSPRLVLSLLHFALFMNAFEFSFFLWVTWQFGIQSCYHDYIETIVVRILLALLVHIICSYVTLPLYALVTQMGSRYRNTILEEGTIDAIKQWHGGVKQRRRVETTTSELRFHNNLSSSESNEDIINNGSSTDDRSSYDQTHQCMPSFVSLNGSEIVADVETYYQYYAEDDAGNRIIDQNEIEVHPRM